LLQNIRFVTPGGLGCRWVGERQVAPDDVHLLAAGQVPSSVLVPCEAQWPYPGVRAAPGPSACS